MQAEVIVIVRDQYTRIGRCRGKLLLVGNADEPSVRGSPNVYSALP
jgi:hypothetical protein